MGVNTKYKDSLFSFLFSDPDLLRELYCALEGVSLPASVPVSINTLRDVLFMDMINDISFEIGGKLVILIEHQSTINPNMALRLLMYIARIYEKIISGKNIYSRKLIRIPRPEFFVLYNGVEPYPEEAVLRLSEMFESAAMLGLREEEKPVLELEVKVLNINQGKNEGIARKCKTLSEYSAFVATARRYEREEGEREEAIKKTVRYCLEAGILKDFLEKNAVEVMSMLMTEWNMEDALAVRFEEGMEKGIERGMERGREEGMERGREEGMERGMEKGREKGIEEGMKDAARKAFAEGVSIEFVKKITGLDDDTLKDLQKGTSR